VDNSRTTTAFQQNLSVPLTTMDSRGRSRVGRTESCETSTWLDPRQLGGPPDPATAGAASLEGGKPRSREGRPRPQRRAHRLGAPRPWTGPGRGGRYTYERLRPSRSFPTGGDLPPEGEDELVPGRGD
jgi:hypothetical protein